MKIKFAHNTVIFDNSLRCVKNIVVLSVCSALFVLVLIEGIDEKLGLWCAAIILGITLIESIFFNLLVSGFIIDENGITEVKVFIFRRHILWKQIKEYRIDDYMVTRGVARHRRFVFVYGKKSKTVYSPFFCKGNEEDEDKINRFCAEFYKKDI